MNRRSLLGSGIAWAALPLSASAQPQYAGMTATLTFPAQSGGPPGTAEFAEAGGPGMTAQHLADFVDPRGAFEQSRVRVTRADFPGFRVEFARLRDGSWASVEFHWGEVGVKPVNLSNGYSVVVRGDFSGAGKTPMHWWGARWRLSGGRGAGTLKPGRNGWPITPVPYARLVADHLIPDFDPTQNGSANTVSHAGPQYASAYTPMGNSSYTTQMGAAGGRPDISMFNMWDSQLLASLSPTAGPALVAMRPALMASTQALAEAAASIPWHLFDPKNGCAYERVVNHVGAGWPPPRAPGTTMGVTISGRPGTYSFPVASYVAHPAVRGELFWLPRSVTIPAAGTVTVQGFLGNAILAQPPTGAPIAVLPGTTVPAGMTFAWADLSTFSLGNPWEIDTSHCPETGYVAYILWRDPWDLFSVQANAMFYAGPTYSFAQVRQAAWDYRSAACAAAATPNSVPPWLLPRSTMEKWLNAIQTFFMVKAVNGTTPLSTVFFAMEAAGGSGNNCADGKRCDGTPCWMADQWMNPWQNAYCAQAAAFCLLTRPTDAHALAIARYILTGIDARYNGTSGWPRTLPTLEHMGVRAVSGGPLYTSLADAWAGQKHYVMIRVVDRVCAEQPLPATLIVTPGGSDYPNNDFAALSLGVQAGLTQFRASRDYVGEACKKGGYIEDARAFRQV